MKMTGAQLIIALLERQGIRVIAGIPGGCNLPLYHELAQSNIRHVLTRHEQGAGFIAQGMARTTGKPAVCFATSGPAATNLLTAIADARLDSIPIIAITGQVPRALIGTDAFQEIDMYGLTVPITKHNYLVRSAQELLEVIPSAFRIASSGRPGPVAIDVPKDVQTETVEFSDWPAPGEPDAPAAPGDDDVRRVAEMINNAKRPVMYIGGGIVAGGASEAVRRIVEKSSIPVTSTLMGLGAMPTSHPQFLGMLGMHGRRSTNLLMGECDLVIAAGVRFDDRATGKAAEFCSQAQVLHIDIDASELGKIRRPFLGVAADVALTLTAAEKPIDANPRMDWQGRLAELRAQDPPERPERYEPFQPWGIIRRAGEILDGSAVVCTDVGQHQMWTAQTYPFEYPRQFLTSGGLGTMGFGMPAAIGAALACPDRTVVCFSGDGSILMNIQELVTAAEVGANVKVIVMNNGHLGLVRQQQQLFYEGRYIATRFEVNPDLPAIARGFGIRGYALAEASDPVQMLEQALTEPGPCLIDVPIPADENVYPMVPPGAANSTMIGEESHVSNGK